MKYSKERKFLIGVPSCVIRELLSSDLWDSTEKLIMQNMYGNKNDKKTIEWMIQQGILNYERSRAYDFYKSGLLKLQKMLKKTRNPVYQAFYKALI